MLSRLFFSRRKRALASVYLTLLFLSPTPLLPLYAGDDAVFSLKVKRASGYLGAAVSQGIYINDRFVGYVATGNEVRFSVPVSRDGRYRMKIATWDSIYDNPAKHKHFYAKAGDEVHADTSVHVLSGNMIDSLNVIPHYPCHVYVHTIKPVDFELEGIQYHLDTSGILHLPAKTTLRRFLRLTLKRPGGTPSGEPLFVTPTRMTFIALNDRSNPKVRAMRTMEFTSQIKAAAGFHFISDTPNITQDAENFEADLKSLDVEEIPEVCISYRTQRIAWAQRLATLNQETIFGTAAASALEELLLCGAEAAMTRSYPTRMDAMVNASQAVIQTAMNVWGKNSLMAAETAKVVKAETAALQPAWSELSQHSDLQTHPCFADDNLQQKLLGTWHFEFPIDKSARSYTFQTGGRLQERLRTTGALRTVGTYLVSNGKVIIRWNSGSQETADCNKMTPQGFLYNILEHTSDSQQIGLSIPFEKAPKLPPSKTTEMTIRLLAPLTLTELSDMLQPKPAAQAAKPSR